MSDPSPSNQPDAQGPAESTAPDSPLWDQATLRYAALGLGVCLLAALVATWPLALHPSTTIPLGHEEADTVPVFSLYTLWWVGDRVAHGLTGFWNAPFFHPMPMVAAWTEPLLVPGFAVAPLWMLGAPPALAYNVALLLILTLDGAFTLRLARALEAPRPAALLAGVLGVTLSFLSKEQGVLPVLPIFGLLCSLDGALRFSRDGETRHAVQLGLGLVVQFGSGQQLTLFGFPLVVAAGLLALLAQRRNPGALIRLAVTGAVTADAMYLLSRPAVRVNQMFGFFRYPETVTALSAKWTDFLSRSPTALVGWPHRTTLADFSGGLFPGLLLLLLAVAGVGVALRRRQRRGWVVFLVLGIVLEVLFARAMHVKLGDFQPFVWLRVHVAGFAQLRAVTRAALLAQMLLPPLAAIALGAVWERWPRRGVRVGVIALAVLAAGENLCIPMPLVAVPLSPATPWTTWLRAHPEQRIVAHLPVSTGDPVQNFAIDAWRQFAQLDHGRPILNGYSSNFPAGSDELGELVNRFPARGSRCVLQRYGFDTLIVEHAWLESRRAAIAAEPSLPKVYEDPRVAIYRLVPDPSCTQRPAGPAAPGAESQPGGVAPTGGTPSPAVAAPQEGGSPSSTGPEAATDHRD